jgi:hypothetical protein
MLRLLLICASALMMVSCLDCHEEIWLNADGSGKARIEVSIPTQAARIHGGQSGVEKQVAEYLKETPEFRSYDVSVSTKKDRLHIRIAVSFDNAMDLSQTTTGASFEKLPAAARDLAGHADVRFKGLKILYHRRIDLTRAIPGSAWIPHDQLKHHAIETVLHLPVAATEHNADSTANAGKTLIWKTPVSRALRHPQHQTFTMPLPLPWSQIILYAAVGLAVMFGLYVSIKAASRRRHRESGQVI